MTKPALVTDTDPWAAFPPELRGARLEEALATAVPGEWPEDDPFVVAEQPAAIAEVLIDVHHPELAPARLAVLFKQQMAHGERLRLGSMRRAAGLLGFLGDVDFVMLVNWKAWRVLGAVQRVALIDHELYHAGLDAKGRWTLIHHDVEEFAAVVGRWGLWRPDLVTFAAQIELFPKDRTA